VFWDFAGASSSHLVSVILLHEGPHFDRAFKFSRISEEWGFAGALKYDFWSWVAWGCLWAGYERFAGWVVDRRFAILTVSHS